MGMLDGLLGQLAGNVDIASLAQKVGISPQMAEMAVAALGRAHPQPGDTVATAAAETGLPHDTLHQIIGHLGGEGELGRLAGMLGQQEGGGMLGGLGSLLGRS